MTVDDAATLRHDLERAVRGRVHLPGEPTWDDARRAWNLAVDQQPRAVVEVADADDVAAAVRCAGRLGLPVVAQSLGHGASAGGTEGAVLLRMHALDSVEIDVDDRLARVGGGALWKAVLQRLDGTGLLALGGTAAEISVVGYTLGGGLSWFGRRHGQASGAVRSVHLVTPDGEQVTVTATSDPELFWAIRGCGGEFGIVTAMEFELFESPGIVGVRLLFGIDDAEPVLRAFSALTETAPRGLSASAGVLHLPDLPMLPEAQRGKSFVGVTATHLGSLAEAEELVAAVAAAGTPVENVIEPIQPSGLAEVAGDPVDPTPGIDQGTLLRRFDAESVEHFLAAVGPGSGTPLVSVGVRHLGGALNDPRCGHGGVAGPIEEPFLAFAVGVPGLGGTVDDVRDALRGLRTALGDAATDRAPYNFLGQSGVESAFDAATLTRLRELKKHRDPQTRFRMTRPLLP